MAQKLTCIAEAGREEPPPQRPTPGAEVRPAPQAAVPEHKTTPPPAPPTVTPPSGEPVRQDQAKSDKAAALEAKKQQRYSRVANKLAAGEEPDELSQLVYAQTLCIVQRC
jgi:hypothetical protein